MSTLRSALDLLTGRRDAEGQPLGPRREATRQRIVAAAAEQLLAVGYKQMRVEDVAAAAKVSRPTLYSYFSSKELLLIAAMSEEASERLGAVQALFDEELAPEDRLRAWVRESVRYIIDAPLTARLAADRDPEVMEVLLEHPLARTALGLNPDLSKEKIFSALIDAAFPKAFTPKQRKEFASVLRSLGHMAPALLAEQTRFGLSVDRLANLYADLLVGGLRSLASDK